MQAQMYFAMPSNSEALYQLSVYNEAFCLHTYNLSISIIYVLSELA